MNFLRTLIFYLYLFFTLPTSAVLINFIYVIVFMHHLFTSKQQMNIAQMNSKQMNAIMYFMQKNWAQALIRIPAITLRCHGRSQLKKNEHYLFLCNHLSSFDIFTLLASSPVPIAFLSKPLYFKIPFLSACMRFGGHISIDRKSPKKALKSIINASKQLENGKHIIVFPEGTRSKNSQVGNFKTTPLSLLNHAKKVRLVPVTICGTDNIQKKNSLLVKKSLVSITYGKPISAKATKIETMQIIESTIKKTYAAEKKLW